MGTDRIDPTIDMTDMTDMTDKTPEGTSDKTPPPVSTAPVDLPERRRRLRTSDGTASDAVTGAADADAALAAWDAEFPFESTQSDAPATPEVAPPTPDSDLVLDVTEESPAYADDGPANESVKTPTTDQTPTAVESRESAWAPPAADAFEGELPSEPALGEVGPSGFGFGPLVNEFDLSTIAARLAASPRGEASAQGNTISAAEADLLAEELNLALEGATATSHEIAGAAVAAARAQEGISSEQALSHYRQALAVEPGFAPALRGLLRLARRSGDGDAALLAVAGLAEAVPADASSYQEFLDEAQSASAAARSKAGVAEQAGPGDAVSTSALLRSTARALRAELSSATAPFVEQLAENFGGEAAVALRTFAAMLRQLDGHVPAADDNGQAVSAAAASAGAFRDLRAALVLPADAALPRVMSALAALPSSPLSPGLLRWAARLARRGGDDFVAQQLLERARALGAALLPAGEGIDVVSTDVSEALPVLLDRLGGVTNEVVALLAGRLGAGLLSAGRVGDVLAVLAHALARDPDSGPALAPLLSQILATPTDAASHDEARKLLITADPARRSEVVLQATLATLATLATPSTLDKGSSLQDTAPIDAASGDSPVLLEARAALAQQAAERGDPALAWWLSWHLRGAGRSSEAAAALTGAAAGFGSIHQPEIARALRARAAVLTASTDLASYAATLPVGNFADPESQSDPGALARALLDGEREPRSYTALFQAAAQTGSAHRLYEAAGWAVQAGAFKDALGILAAAPAEIRGSETGARFLFRLMRLGDDPAAAAALLHERAEATSDPQQQALFAQLGAESLERAGRRAEAALVYRELLASPLAKDADLALRRALLALGDADGLLGFWRDEYDACSGAGKDRAAAAASLEKARVTLDFSDDVATASAEVATALTLAPDSLPALVLSLCQPRSPMGGAERPRQVEALAALVPPHAHTLLFLAGLLAEGEGEGEARARRLFKEALQASGGRPATALLRRHLLAEETAGATPSEMAQSLGASAAALGKTTGADPRLATALYLRAAEAAEAAGDLERTEFFIERALALEPADLPSLVRLHGLQQIRGDIVAALRTLETEAGVLRDPARRAAALFAAAEISADQLADLVRSSSFLARVLDIDPRHEGAFVRQKRLLEGRGDVAGVAALLGRRAQSVDGATAVRLRLERAALLVGTLADRPSAKRELREILAIEPKNLFALYTLSTMEQEDGDPKIAADLSWQQVQIERDPARLLDCLLRLGRLYRGPLADAALAASAYERALALDEENHEALEALSDLYARAGDASRGITVIDRLLELESDKERRRPLLLRLGALWEAAGDVRRAGVSLRHAADEYPGNLDVISDLVRFYERQNDEPARNFLLDGAIGLLRNDVRADRDRVSALRALVSLLRWRGRPASALAAAKLLSRLAPTPAQRVEAAALAASAANALGQDGRARMHSLAELRADERALPPDLPAGLPHVMRILGPHLVRATKPDLKRFQVGRAEKQARGSQVRSELDHVAQELGVRDFDAYVTLRLANALAVEPGEPAAVIVGAGIAAQGGPALRFAAAYCMRLVGTHFSLLLRDGPLEAAALVAGFVRQFVPDHRPAQIPDLLLEAATARVGRVLNRSLRGELGPLAVQLSAPSTPEALFTSVQETAARAGLLACGDIAVALDVLAVFSGRSDAAIPALFELPLIARLVDFSLSDDYDALVGNLAADGPPGS